MNDRGNARYLAVWILGLTSISSVLGCGSKTPFGFVPVQGKITYDDGSLIPVDSILLTFSPILPKEKGKMVPPGGRTEVNVQDGTFSAVSSYRVNDGLVVGRHKVMVIAFKKGPNGSLAPSDVVPAVYSKEASTPLEVEVESSNQFLELKVSKK